MVHDLDRAVFATRYSLDRYRMHFQRATTWDLLGDLVEGEEVSTGHAMALLGRGPDSHQAGDRFVLSALRQGLFVIMPARHVKSGVTRPDLCPWVVGTYFRFQETQQRMARELWPSCFAKKPESPIKVAPPWGDTDSLVYAKQVAARKNIVLSFHVQKKEGPDHEPLFTLAMKNGSGDVLGLGQGSNKRVAGAKAAEAWLWQRKTEST